MKELEGKMNDGGERVTFGEGCAQREPDFEKGQPHLMSPYAIRRLAKWYSLGSAKYGDYNWQKGMPYSRYTSSMFRHVLAWMEGDTSEDHLAAIAWNSFAIMHHQEMGEDYKWDNMPHYEEKKKQILKDKQESKNIENNSN